MIDIFLRQTSQCEASLKKWHGITTSLVGEALAEAFTSAKMTDLGSTNASLIHGIHHLPHLLGQQG